jgi:hypothetical protein
MQRQQDRPSLATLADNCDQAARYLKGAASALRHGTLSTARQKLAAAKTITDYLDKQSI